MVKEEVFLHRLRTTAQHVQWTRSTFFFVASDQQVVNSSFLRHSVVVPFRTSKKVDQWLGSRLRSSTGM
jgi:hypothetical protein